MSLSETNRYYQERCLSRHLIPRFGDYDISQISDTMINEFIADQLDHGNLQTGKPVSPNTIYKYLGMIRAIYRYGIDKGYIDGSPMDTIHFSRVPSAEFQIFSEAEVQLLISAARPKWLGDMILLAYHTGMRRGEIYGLQWADIDFDRSSLRIKRSVTSYSPHDFFVRPPKTKRSNRLLMLDMVTIDMLSRRLSCRKSDTWIFPNQYGKLMSPFYNVKYFQRACEVAGIPIRRFHDLRHSHITWLLMHNVPLKVVQERAGHSNISITLNTYTHYIPSMQQCAVDALNQMLPGQ